MAIANRFGLLAYDRFAQLATVTANFTPLAGFPLTNLQNLRLFSTTRTSTLSGATITFDLGSNKSINGAAIVANLSDAATWRVEFSQVSNFAVLQADTGTINAFTSLPGLGLGYKQPWGRPVFAGIDTVSARYVRFTFTDAGNTDGILIFSVAGIGLLWTPARAQSLSTRPLPDQVVGEPGTEKSLRGHSVAWLELTHAERAQLAEIQRAHGTTGRMFVVPFPAERDKHPDSLFWGRFESQFDASLFVKTASVEKWSVNAVLREVDE
jgi:hypothetical protein